MADSETDLRQILWEEQHMNQEIKIAVCDDLAEDRENITRLLSEYTDKNNLYVKIEEFSSVEAFLSSDTSVYSLVFMDIFMSGMNGMETAKKLISRNSRVQIVFGSTSTEFAAEAFDIEALHYMVKPVRKEKLFHILDRFFDSVYSLRTVNVKVGRLEESIYISDILSCSVQIVELFFINQGNRLFLSISDRDLRQSFHFLIYVQAAF